MKRGIRYRGLTVVCLIAVLLLAGCSVAGEDDGGGTAGMAQSGGSGDMQPEADSEASMEISGKTSAEASAEGGQSSPAEEQDSLAEELDALVKGLKDRDILWKQEDLLSEETADFPQELIRQLQEALALGSSDELLQELADNELRIERDDFVYRPATGEELDQWNEEVREKVSEALSGDGEAASYDFYRLDLDGDEKDEILMVERTRYEHYPGGKAVILKQNEDTSYGFGGYSGLTYHRLYAVFEWEGSYYIVCNCDNTENKVTKSLSIFALEEGDEDWPQISWRNICLGRSSTSCDPEQLWTADLGQELQAAMWDYIRQISSDLMLRQRNSVGFSGEEVQIPLEERKQVMAALGSAVWAPEHLGYSAQKQRWIFTLEGQEIYFALYYCNAPEQYLVEAFFYEREEAEKPMPVALYGLFPHVEVSIQEYWDFMESNIETVVLQTGEDAGAVFCENRSDVTTKLWRKVNEGVLSTGTSEEQLVPPGLVDLAKEALFTGDRSALARLAEPIELTDHDEVMEKWFSASSEDMAYINYIYQYTIGEDTYLLLAIDSGGSARFMVNDCYRLTSDGAEYLGDQWNTYEDDYVVPYEGNFYLVDSNYNFYSKYVDTIYIHPLTPQGISEDATVVSLEPEAYVFNKGYRSDSSVLEQVDRYVEEIQQELMEASPINDDVRVFMGCEETVTDPVLLQRLLGGYDYYTVDWDNDGRQEYLSRHYWYPSNATTLKLLTEQYRMGAAMVELQEAWEPECPYAVGYTYEQLIQLWYQEFEGKIYTFRLFLTEGYNYYLSVSLVEESQVSWIASYYVTPRCEWQIASSQNHTGDG